MRVWLVHPYAVPPAQAGPPRPYALARELIRRGHAATIIASGFDHVRREEARLRPGEAWRWEVVDGVPFLWLRTPPYPGNTSARVWNMAVFAQQVSSGRGTRVLPRPDVIIGSSPHLFGA